MRIKDRIRAWRLAQHTRTARRVCLRIDRAMRAMGFPHWKRKQMWRDIIRSEDVRKEMFSILAGGRER